MPAWDYQLPPRPDARPGERPPISEARLDIRIPEPSGRGRMINVDIGFADPYTVDLAELRRRAQKPGRAAAANVYHKQQTYPVWRNSTEDLVLFIIASFGHPSVRAVNFLRQMAPSDRSLRSLELGRAYREHHATTACRTPSVRGGQFQAELNPPPEYVRNAGPRCNLMQHSNIEASTCYQVYIV